MTDKIQWTTTHQALWHVLDQTLKEFKNLKLLSERDYDKIIERLDKKMNEKII